VRRQPAGQVGRHQGGLPWLILADKNHQVVAEGFPIEELDAKLKELAK